MKRHLWLLSIALLFFSTALFAQQGVVTGTVKADDGTLLPGAAVQIKGTSTGVTTNLDGQYTIDISGYENPVITFTYVGYLTEEVEVGSQTEINIQLVPDIQSLDEIVVVGYGVQKKSLVTGAISKISSEELTQTQNLRVEQALQGKASGVIVVQESGSPGAAMKVRIRGTGTNGNSNPLYIVDGIRTGGIDYLATSDIESVEILKDAASAAIYGSDAANGVVLITTKKGTKGAGQVTYDGYYGIQNASHYS